MEKHGINKSKLAEIAGVGTSAVTKWVQGGAIRISQLKKIADFFGVDIHELMPTEQPQSVRKSEISDELIFWKARALNAEDKLKIVNDALGLILEGTTKLKEAVK